ncbi:MAG: hypothetical protein NTU81_01140 [Candidatus Nomurabacteria bacterium]|nr:hypothetical protein [Candidatus Nomurabacteria bacterium]
MKSKEILEQYSEELKKIGLIIFNLNYIEIEIITILSLFFNDKSDCNSVKNFILNDAFFDNQIFSTLQNKINLLHKIINNLEIKAEEKYIF